MVEPAARAAGAAIAGVAGMFLVVPAIGVVAATWRTVLSVLGSRDQPADMEPEPSPPAGEVVAAAT